MSTDITTLTPFTAEEARAHTDRMRLGAQELWHDFEVAYVRRADIALGYEDWDAYCSAELGGSKLGLPREERDGVIASMRSAGMPQRAIASATGISKTTVNEVSKGLYQSGTDDRVVGLDGRSRPASKPPRERTVDPPVEWNEPESATEESEDDWPEDVDETPSFLDEVRHRHADVIDMRDQLAPEIEEIQSRQTPPLPTAEPADLVALQVAAAQIERITFNSLPDGFRASAIAAIDRSISHLSHLKENLT